MSNEARFVVTTSGLYFNIREAGAGPLFLRLQGITANGSVWDPAIEMLSDRFRVVAVNQRGHGRSSKPAAGYEAKDFAADVPIVRGLGDSQVVVVGHSLGARNALVVAANYPEMVRGAIVVDFTPFIEPEVFDSLVQRVRDGDREFFSIQEIHDYLRDRYPSMPADAIARRASHGYERSGGGYRALACPSALAQTASGLREELEAVFKKVRQPMLVVHGALSKLVSKAAYEKTLRLRPDIDRAEVVGADHYVPEKAPAIISALTAQFMGKHHVGCA